MATTYKYVNQAGGQTGVLERTDQGIETFRPMTEEQARKSYDPVAIGLPKATPAQSSTPAVPSVDTARYDRGQFDQARNIVENIPEQKTEDQLRREELERQNARIQAIGSVFAEEKAREVEAGQRREGRARAALAVAGLTGSEGEVGSKIEEQKGFTERQLKNVEARQALAIQDIYDRVDASVKEKLAVQKAETKQAAEATLQRLAKQATQDIQGLAASMNGTSFQDFRNADKQTYQQLKELSGLGDYQLQEMWNQAIPERLRPKFQEIVTIGENGNAFIKRVQYSPKTGQLVDAGSYDTGVPYTQYPEANVVKGSDGAMYIPDPADPNSYKRITPMTEEERKLITVPQGSRLVDPATGEIIVEGAPKEATDAEKLRYLKGQQLNKAKEYVESIKDSEGHIDPKEYQRLLAEYTEKVGDASEFNDVFGSYLTNEQRRDMGIGKSYAESEDILAEFAKVLGGQ